MKAFLGHEQIQSKAGEIVRYGLHIGVLFLVENLAVSVAFATSLCPDGLGAGFDGMVGDAFGGEAMAAGYPNHVPLGLAQSAMQIAVALRPPFIRANDTGNG